MENFENVKVGDKVVIVTNWGKKIATVDKVTPKRFKIGETYYEKKDGSEYGGGYSFEYCVHVTDEIVNEIARRQEWSRMRSVLSKVNVRSYNYEQTKLLYNFMKEHSLIAD